MECDALLFHFVQQVLADADAVIIDDQLIRFREKEAFKEIFRGLAENLRSPRIFRETPTEEIPIRLASLK